MFYLHCDTRKVTVYINKLPRYAVITCSTDGGGLLMVRGLQGSLPENDCKLDNAHLVTRFWLLRIKMLDTLDSLKNIGGHRLDLLREGNCFTRNDLYIKGQNRVFNQSAFVKPG